MTQPIDTPDYQRGVVNAQSLIASVASGTDLAIVGVPPNSETLVVLFQGSDVGATITVRGDTTGLYYPVVAINQPTVYGIGPTFFADIASCLDQRVSIETSQIPVGGWYVYSDTAARVIVDGSAATDINGAKYVVPVVPSTQTGDHPPNEISHIGAFIAASGAIASGAGAGERYRVYAATMSTVTAGVVAQITDFTTGATLLTLAGPGNSQLPYIPQGIPLTNNASLGYQLLTGAGSVLLGVYYTIETI